ncbi:MAG: hypothetical protein LBM73_03640 [Candidatus Nomurabacteria bacterium]|jgi:hypothetical protein|nr:hypothetical protein [Candidatus Nomurabacteria bacterium]
MSEIGKTGAVGANAKSGAETDAAPPQTKLEQLLEKYCLANNESYDAENTIKFISNLTADELLEIIIDESKHKHARQFHSPFEDMFDLALSNAKSNAVTCRKSDKSEINLGEYTKLLEHQLAFYHILKEFQSCRIDSDTFLSLRAILSGISRARATSLSGVRRRRREKVAARRAIERIGLDFSGANKTYFIPLSDGFPGVIRFNSAYC